MLVASNIAKEVTDIEALASLPTRCTYAYAYEMYGAHCAGLRLSKIPSLKGGIEVSYNIFIVIKTKMYYW